MTTLKQARDSGNLDKFIAEREAEAKAVGDLKTFDATLSAMVKTSKSARETLKLRRSGG